jgi:hypothetical protein
MKVRWFRQDIRKRYWGFSHIPTKRYIPDATRSGLTVRKAFRRGSTLWNGSRSGRHHSGLGMTAGQEPTASDVRRFSSARSARKGPPPIRESESFDDSMRGGVPRASPVILGSPQGRSSLTRGSAPNGHLPQHGDDGEREPLPPPALASVQRVGPFAVKVSPAAAWRPRSSRLLCLLRLRVDARPG